MNDINRFACDFDASNEFPFSLPRQPLLEPAILKIYLASPLTNNDPDAQEDCRFVREITNRIFHDYEYLGVRFQVYDPAEVTPPGSEHTSEEVYLTDHNRTATADLVIFHVNSPSLGVGMEAQIAAGATVPRVVVSRKHAKISRMFLGVCSPTVATIHYTNDADFEAALFKQLPDIAREATEKARRRRVFVDGLRESAIGKKIFRQRILQGMSIDQLAHLIDIDVNFLRRLERDPELAANITLIQLNRIVSATECQASMTPSGVQRLTVSDTDLPNCRKASLDNLIEFITSQPAWLPDDRVFRVWRNYVEETEEETAEAIRHRGESVVSIDEWRQKLERPELF